MATAPSLRVPPVFATTGATGATSTATPALTVSASAQVGDRLVLHATLLGGVSTATPPAHDPVVLSAPAGWTLRGTQAQSTNDTTTVAWWTKTCTTADIGADVTVTSNVGGRCGAALFVVKGVSNTAVAMQINVVQNTGTNTVVNLPGFTPTTGDWFALTMMGTRWPPSSTPALPTFTGYTEVVDTATTNTTGQLLGLWAATRTAATTTAVPDVSVTLTGTPTPTINYATTTLLFSPITATVSVNAGVDQNVEAWDTVTVSASVTGGSGATGTQSWTSSPSVPLTVSPGGRTATFAAPASVAGGAYTLTYSYTDSNGSTASDSLVVNVKGARLLRYVSGVLTPVRRYRPGVIGLPVSTTTLLSAFPGGGGQASVGWSDTQADTLGIGTDTGGFRYSNDRTITSDINLLNVAGLRAKQGDGVQIVTINGTQVAFETCGDGSVGVGGVYMMFDPTGTAVRTRMDGVAANGIAGAPELRFCGGAGNLTLMPQGPRVTGVAAAPQYARHYGNILKVAKGATYTWVHVATVGDGAWSFQIRNSDLAVIKQRLIPTTANLYIRSLEFLGSTSRLMVNIYDGRTPQLSILATNVDSATDSAVSVATMTQTPRNVENAKSLTVSGSGTGASVLPRVTRTGSTLRTNGVTRRFSGANAYWLALNDNTRVGGVATIPSTTVVQAALDQALSMNASVLRVHTLGINYGNAEGNNPPTIMPTNGTYNETAFVAVDRIIYEAGKRGLYLIAPMADRWNFYHGGGVTFAQMVLGGTRTINDFFTNTTVKTAFKAYLTTWLNRVNTLTGVAYKNDTTLLALELGNEMYDAPLAWTSEMAAHVKGIAPNLLVADPTAASGKPVTDSNVALSDANVDIFGLHSYPRVASALTTAVNATVSAGKAFFLGEYDWTTTPQDGVTNTGSTSTPAQWLSLIESTSGISIDAWWTLTVAGTGPHRDGYELQADAPENATQTSGRSVLTTHAQVVNPTTTAPGTYPLTMMVKDGGVFVSTNATTAAAGSITWTPVSGGPETSQWWFGAGMTTTTGPGGVSYVLFASTTGGVKVKGLPNTIWRGVVPATSTQPATSITWSVPTVGLQIMGIPGNASTWWNAGVNTPNIDGTAAVSDFQFSPLDPNRGAMVSKGITYLTTDAGATWYPSNISGSADHNGMAWDWWGDATRRNRMATTTGDFPVAAATAPAGTRLFTTQGVAVLAFAAAVAEQCWFDSQTGELFAAGNLVIGGHSVPDADPNNIVMSISGSELGNRYDVIATAPIIQWKLANDTTVAVTPTAATLAVAVNNVQTVKVTATGGTFKLIWNGSTTANIAYNATASAVASALNATAGTTAITATGTLANGLDLSFPGLPSSPLSATDALTGPGAKVAVTVDVPAVAKVMAGCNGYGSTGTNGTIVTAKKGGNGISWRRRSATATQVIQSVNGAAPWSTPQKSNMDAGQVILDTTRQMSYWMERQTGTVWRIPFGTDGIPGNATRLFTQAWDYSVVRDGVGFVDIDIASDRLWVSTKTGVYFLNGASTAAHVPGALTTDTFGAFASVGWSSIYGSEIPGPMCYRPVDGSVFVATQHYSSPTSPIYPVADGTDGPRHLVVSNPTVAASWQKTAAEDWTVTRDRGARTGLVYPSGIARNWDGTEIGITQQGSGLWVWRTASVAP